MKKLTSIFFLTIGICSALLQSCTNKNTSMDISDVDGMKIKTFYNDDNNVAVILISDGDATLAAVPVATMAKARKMGDEEYKCLKACKRSDGSFDMNCVLKCPVTKQLRVAEFSYQ